MKKIYSAMSVLVLLSMILAACATPEAERIIETVIQTVEVPVVETVQVLSTVVSTQEVPVEVPAERVEIRLSGWASSPSETALLESLLYRFSVENPDINVRYEPITGDYGQSMLTMIASGTEPDVFYLDISVFPTYSQEGVLLPLDDLMASTGTSADDFIPALIDGFSFDGSVYGIPKDFNTLGLFYNKDMFDAAGLDYPTDDWTWDDLRAAAEALTDLTDPDRPIYGLGVPPDAGRFPIFVFQNGGSIMNADFSDTLLDSAEAVGAGEYYTSFRTDQIGASPADVGEGWQGTVFGKGQFAMVYEGGWLIPYLTDQFPDINYDVVVPPAGPGGEGNLIFTVSWSISANCLHPEEAWRVIEFLTNEASQTTVLESGFALPTRISLQDSEFLATNSASAAIFRGAFNGAVPFMWGVVASDVNNGMGQGIERVYLEGMSVADSFAQSAAEIRAAIEASR